MTAKQPMQASGGDGRKGAPDGVGPGREAAGGESGGEAYPNPHRGKKPKHSPGDFFGTGGQTEMDYHGPGQLGGEKADKDKPGAAGQGG